MVALDSMLVGEIVHAGSIKAIYDLCTSLRYFDFVLLGLGCLYYTEQQIRIWVN